MTLLREIQDAVVDGNTDTATLLRKCTVLAARLGNTEFTHWVKNEVNGYTGRDKLPQYRIFEVHSKGDFAKFGAMWKNLDIPSACIPKEYRELYSKAHLTQPVAVLETLIQHKGGTEYWNPNFLALIGQNIYQDMVCLSAWKILPGTNITAAIESIKNGILDFVLKIEEENPDAGEAAINSFPIPENKVTNIFNKTIINNSFNSPVGIVSQGDYNNLTQKEI